MSEEAGVAHRSQCRPLKGRKGGRCNGNREKDKKSRVGAARGSKAGSFICSRGTLGEFRLYVRTIPVSKGELKARGKIERKLTLEGGYEWVKVAALNCLAALKSVVGGLDRVRRIVRVTGFINSAPGFEDQSKVMNWASDLLVEIFGNEGKDSRLAAGTSELTLGSPVEVEMIVEVQESHNS